MAEPLKAINCRNFWSFWPSSAFLHFTFVIYALWQTFNNLLSWQGGIFTDCRLLDFANQSSSLSDNHIRKDFLMFELAWTFFQLLEQLNPKGIFQIQNRQVVMTFGPWRSTHSFFRRLKEKMLPAPFFHFQLGMEVNMLEFGHKSKSERYFRQILSAPLSMFTIPDF